MICMTKHCDRLTESREATRLPDSAKSGSYVAMPTFPGSARSFMAQFLSPSIREGGIRDPGSD